MPAARNDCPSPRGLTNDWTSTGTPGGLITRAFDVSALGMELPTAIRHQQGPTSGHARVSAPPKVSDVDLDGQVWSATVQGEPGPAPTRCTNPVCAANTNTWIVGGGTGARVTGLSGMVATTGYRATTTPAGAVAIGGDRAAVTPGETITGTIQARCSVATSIQWLVDFYDINDVGLYYARLTGATVAAAANTAYVGAVSGIVPAGAVYARAIPLTGPIPAGATLTATGHRVDAVTDPAMEYASSISCSVELVFRDASGAALSTITSIGQTVATGTAVTCKAVGTAPAGTRRVQAVFLARAVAAKSMVYGTACRLDQVNDAALPYRDGASAGWTWEDVALQSTSTSATPSPGFFAAA